MCHAKEMAEIYESNRAVCKYVHSTSRGHEAIQLATAFHLQPCDYVSPYYRDESMLLGLGLSPLQLMLQLLAKADDIFTGGREYYSHLNYRGDDKPTIIHQSSASRNAGNTDNRNRTRHSISRKQFRSTLLKKGNNNELKVVVSSLVYASITEVEVSEEFQFAVLKKLPIIYLVQDNSWGISVSSRGSKSEWMRLNMLEVFTGMQRIRIDGSDFEQSYEAMNMVIDHVRKESPPISLFMQKYLC